MNTNVKSWPCPLCGATTRPIAPAAGRALAHCPDCELISVSPQCHLSDTAQRDRYRLHRNTPENAEYVRRFQSLIDALEARTDPPTSTPAPSSSPPTAAPRRALDFGCGPAPVLVDLLRRRGYDAAGYDPHFAPEADLSRPFDAVFCVETFEHFTDPAADVDRAIACVRPGGLLAVMTQFHPGPQAIADWWYARDPTHVCFYAPRTLNWIAARHGLIVLECDHRSIAVLRKALARPRDDSCPAG